MKNKLTLLIILVSTICFSQENTNSEIIISRDNLISLLQKFKSKKLEMKSEPKTFYSKDALVEQNINDDSFQSKIVYLEESIARLSRKMDSIPKAIFVRDTIFIANQNNFREGRNNQDNVNKYITKVDTVYIKEKNQTRFASTSTASTNKKYDEELAKLNKKFDLLLAGQGANLIMTATKKKTNTKEEKGKAGNSEIVTNEQVVALDADFTPVKLVSTTDTITKVVAELPNLTNEAVTSIPIVNNEKTTELKATSATASASTFAILTEKYGNLKEKVFFGNNSTEIMTTDAITLGEIATIIEQNPTVDVYLEGFASITGNPTYNEKLSLERTVAVKQFLISKGVHPKRISSHYLGIDAAATTEALARRVDITFEIRK
jgi:outer membrane protein OmpA-like peptidoglycan-associated protein